MKEERTSIGIDFGTANSYFSKKEPSNNVLQNFSWGSNDGEANHYILETAVLYDKVQNKVEAIGQKAVEEYYNNPDENYDLQHWFKPEIASDPKAEKAAIDFIKEAKKIQEAEHRDLFPENADIVVGVPADLDKVYKEALTKIITPQIRSGAQLHFVEEPKGALVSLLDNEKIDVSKLKRGILVVDFGAGTCDFTYIRNAEIVQSWGDPELGGRLFDDIIYNLFVKYHPKASLIEKLPIRSKTIIQHYFCREEKHKFSDSIRFRSKNSDNSLASSESLSVSIGSSLRGENANLAGSCKITYEQFLNEARNYVCSDVMLQCFNAGKKTRFAELLEQSCREPVDLVQRFVSALQQGKLGGKEEIRHVYLAGGSSKLPFVESEIRKVLGGQVIFEEFPDRPYAIIAEGLARLPGFRARCKGMYDDGQRKMPDWIKKSKKEVVFDINCIIKIYAEDIANTVVHKCVKPTIEDYKDEDIESFSNSVKERWLSNDVQSDLQEHCDKFRNSVGERVLKIVEEFLSGIVDKHFGVKELPRSDISLDNHALESRSAFSYVAASVLPLALGGVGVAEYLTVAVLDPTGFMLVSAILLSLVVAPVGLRNKRIREYLFKKYIRKSSKSIGEKNKVLDRLEKKYVKFYIRSIKEKLSGVKIEEMLVKAIEDSLDSCLKMSNL